MANGPHDVTAVARDAAGNVTTSAAVPVTVNNAGHHVRRPCRSRAPAANATVSGTSQRERQRRPTTSVWKNVQFRVDGQNIGAEDTSVTLLPISWNPTADGQRRRTT